jgi:predicted HD superfamily hydrolase involved in NAD metabolism
MSEIDKYREIIAGILSPERFEHSVNTAEMCRTLALRHGCDPDKAYLIGILHDISKEAGEEESKQFAFSSVLGKMNMALDHVEAEVFKLWHGPAGAVYITEKLGLTDVEIFRAVRFHTVGRANMSNLEKIIYLGDLVEKDRDYQDVEKYRYYALEDLNTGMYEALRWAINEGLKKKKQISRYTQEAYNYYLRYER